MAYVAQSKPLSMSFFLLYFKDITFIHTTSSSDVDLSLLRCLSPLSPLCSFSHCPCCGQLLIVHHVVTSVPATLIADVTVEIGGDVFKTEWSTCVFDIISHQKGFPSPLFKGKFKSRCDSRDGGECVKKINSTSVSGIQCSHWSKRLMCKLCFKHTKISVDRVFFWGDDRQVCSWKESEELSNSSYVSDVVRRINVNESQVEATSVQPAVLILISCSLPLATCLDW